jgi:hypothetical protein
METILRELEAAFDRIEQSILPSIAAMLDALIDSAAGARPGMDADAYAEALRTLAQDVDSAQVILAGLLADSAKQNGPGPEKRQPRLSSAA